MAALHRPAPAGSARQTAFRVLACFDRQ